MAMIRKWFLSYLQVYNGGRGFQSGHVVYADEEHPLDKIHRWNRTHGEKEGFVVTAISFHEVGHETPLCDVLTSVVGSNER